MAHNVSNDKYIHLVLCKRERERWRRRKGREREREIGRKRNRGEGEREKGGDREIGGEKGVEGREEGTSGRSRVYYNILFCFILSSPMLMTRH